MCCPLYFFRTVWWRLSHKRCRKFWESPLKLPIHKSKINLIWRDLLVNHDFGVITHSPADLYCASFVLVCNTSKYFRWLTLWVSVRGNCHLKKYPVPPFEQWVFLKVKKGTLERLNLKDSTSSDVVKRSVLNNPPSSAKDPSCQGSIWIQRCCVQWWLFPRLHRHHHRLSEQQITWMKYLFYGRKGANTGGTKRSVELELKPVQKN